MVCDSLFTAFMAITKCIVIVIIVLIALIVIALSPVYAVGNFSSEGRVRMHVLSSTNTLSLMIPFVKYQYEAESVVASELHGSFLSWQARPAGEV